MFGLDISSMKQNFAVVCTVSQLLGGAALLDHAKNVLTCSLLQHSVEHIQ